ncbi:MAG: transcriptional regulator, MarR family [Marmoricola sp.]|nr:transcriptional regulator, MarR family [Marmoricola sp.]
MADQPQPDELNLGLLCFIGFRAVEARVLEALAAAGFDDITPSQGRIAARVGPDGTRIGDLAEQALVTKQTATATVDRLERAGYVRRVADPADARARLVVIAERGERAIKVARVAEAEVQAEWVSHLGARASRQLRSALERIREIADPYQ